MIDRFGLYVILTNPVTGYEKCAEAAVNQSIKYLQLRIKDTDLNKILETALKIKKITSGTNTKLIINDYLDIAIDSDADGIHLGQNDLEIIKAKEKWNNPDKIFGLSTHSLEQEKKAYILNPDYIGVGPVYKTPTKKIPDPVLGLSEMNKIITQTSFTSVAIGGINESNLVDVLNNGAINFSSVRPINESDEPEKVIKKLMDIWEKHYQSGL